MSSSHSFVAKACSYRRINKDFCSKMVAALAQFPLVIDIFGRERSIAYKSARSIIVQYTEDINITGKDS